MGSRNNSTALPWLLLCYYSKEGLYILPSFVGVWSFLVFALHFLVLRTGFQRWQKNKRSTVSHTDFFTYHTFFFHILIFCGYVTLSYGTLHSNFQLTECTVDILTFAMLGLLFLQVLTCIERYLAVAYPIVYLTLRNQLWIWARNVIIFAVWVLGLSWVLAMRAIQLQYRNIPNLPMLGTMAGVILFCSIQVLRTLRNPSPSEGHGVSASKRKAFYTMLAILSVLMLWLTWGIVAFVVGNLNLEPGAQCNFQMSGCWFELPSTLVLPLLFLNRAGKLPGCQGKTTKNTG